MSSLPPLTETLTWPVTGRLSHYFSKKANYLSSLKSAASKLQKLAIDHKMAVCKIFAGEATRAFHS